jgi:hypothetical protein
LPCPSARTSSSRSWSRSTTCASRVATS